MKSVIKIVHCILCATVVLASCKKEVSCVGCSEKGKAPIAIAGPDQVIILPTDSVLLDGRNSRAPEGSITFYQWSKISGPISFDITNAVSALTIAKNLIVGTYLFELKVVDNTGLSARDTAEIVVSNAGQPNGPPIADAGPDQTITLPVNTITLNGSASTDPDNSLLGYAWRKISGPASFNITDSNAVQTQVANLVEGIYQFQLKVTDAGGLFSVDSVKVIVNSYINIVCGNRPIINAQLVTIGSLSEGRFALVTAAAGNKILFAGGFSPGAYSTRVDIYDLSNNTWSIAELSGGRQGMTAASVGNKIFFAGGGDNDIGSVTSRVDIYDVGSNTWTTAELSEARVELSSVAFGNKVYFAGGIDALGVRSDRVDVYDNSTNTWTTDSLSQGRNQLSVTVAGNKIYFAGGFADNPWGVSNTIDIYNTITNTWTTSGLLEGKMAFASIAVDNTIYWASGINSLSSGGSTASNVVEIRDVNTQISTTACMLPKSQFSAVLRNDNIIFFTGYPGNPNQFDIYNMVTGEWSIGSLNQSVNAAAIISVNNAIYVAGGTINGSGYFNQVWKLEF